MPGAVCRPVRYDSACHAYNLCLPIPFQINLMKNQDDKICPETGGQHTERLQVLLSRAGVASRRHAADLIRDGRVTLDGMVTREPGLRVNPETAIIHIDGEHLEIDPAPDYRTIMLYKPRGLICSLAFNQGATVYECLAGVRERLLPVGRLDKNSEGLLLLTNDGDLIHELTHPRFGHSKEYVVTVSGEVQRGVLERLRYAMRLGDGTVLRAPLAVELLESDSQGSWRPLYRLRIVLGEGRNRQVRRMCEAVGLRVRRLIRVAIDDLYLPGTMQPGDWRDLTPEDFELLGL